MPKVANTARKAAKIAHKAANNLAEFNAKAEHVTRSELANLRTIIDKIDDLIIQSIARRMTVSMAIGSIKKENTLAVRDRKREKELQKFHKQLAKKHKISYKTLQKIFSLIMVESKRIQK